MPPNRDYYETLGVSRNADEAAIKSAYRKLARELHPDRNKAPDAAAKFAQVQEAYDALSDPDKRRMYDQFGTTSPGTGGFHPGGGAGGTRVRWSHVGPEGSPFGEGGMGDIGDVFEQIFGGAVGGGGAGPFGDPRAGTRASTAGKARPGRARDTEAAIEVDFTTAALGGQRTIRVEGAVPRVIDVKIPRGFSDGGKLRVRGAGSAPSRGGTAGDLILTVRVAAHPWFKRQNLDLELELPLSIVEAALGTRVNVPTLTGKVELSVPPGTSSGQRLRLKGLGVRDEAGNTGDLFVVAKVVAPKSLSPEDKALLEKLGVRLPSVRSGGAWE